MSDKNQAAPIPDGSGEALKQFQLTTDSIKDKSSRDYGLSISKYIFSTISEGLSGYYAQRNARFLKNRNYASGKIDVQAMFQDRFQMNGKQNYIKLNWQTLQLVNRIISGLVGRWMARNEKISVTAIDSLSVRDKENEYDQIEFLLHNRAQLEMLEKESGVQLIPKDKFIPADQEELNLWQAQLQRLPEEILFELGCNDVLASNGWFDVLKEKMLHDSAEVLFVGTYTWMDDTGVIHVEWVKPENAIYSYSEYPDFRDTTWRGQAPSRKISELRRRYGKEFNPNNPFALTEEQLWEIAQKSKDFQYNTNINSWNNEWVNTFMRPYDEWNVKVIEFELKSPDSEPYTVTKTKKTSSTYTQKGVPATSSGKKREKPLDNQHVIADTNWNIYRGVYLPDCELLVEWGLKDNMIRPQDPKEIGNAEFSYTFYMPQNYQMRNLAVPEKIEAAIDGMILALLKMQQVVARMRPTGAAINESALQEIDYGLGESGNKNVDVKKQYDQTGDIYYRGMDAEGNPIPVPIVELQNSGFLAQMDGLIRNYQFYYQTLKDELGEDPNLISAALQPRVTAGNVETSQVQSEYATEYMYRAYAYCMADTARKISCLLNDSVTYGASAYRRIVNQEDIKDRIFTTKVQMLPTAQEIAKFELLLNEAMRSTPELVLFVDPFQLMRIAKEDVKLAELTFRQAQKKMLLHQQSVAMQNQQATFEAQMASAKATEEEKRLTKELEGEVDIKKQEMAVRGQNQTSVLSMATALYQKQQETGSPIPAELKPLLKAVMENVGLSSVVASEEQRAMVLQQMQMAEQQQVQEGQQEQQPIINEQPPAEMVA
jgi:hypothetical protein